MFDSSSCFHVAIGQFVSIIKLAYYYSVDFVSVVITLRPLKEDTLLVHTSKITQNYYVDKTYRTVYA